MNNRFSEAHKMGSGGFIQTPLRVAPDPYCSAMKMKSLRLFFSFLINTGVGDVDEVYYIRRKKVEQVND